LVLSSKRLAVAALLRMPRLIPTRYVAREIRGGWLDCKSCALRGVQLKSHTRTIERQNNEQGLYSRKLYLAPEALLRQLRDGIQIAAPCPPTIATQLMLASSIDHGREIVTH
jgi:hypothetical protein